MIIPLLESVAELAQKRFRSTFLLSLDFADEIKYSGFK
jgi:hypothetical protein